MAKDPRFNFYTDNWIGGTEGFTLEQEGAYLALIIMQSKVGRFTESQALDKLMQKTRGNAAACAALWKFLIPKFSFEEGMYFSVRLEKEMSKSKEHSKKQKLRADIRWGNAAALPDNRNGIGNGNGIESEKGVQGEKQNPHEVQLGKPNGHRITVMRTHYLDPNIIIHGTEGLTEHFQKQAQLDAIQRAGWTDFEGFMEANPAAIFNNTNHLYHSLKKYHEKKPAKKSTLPELSYE